MKSILSVVGLLVGGCAVIVACGGSSGSGNIVDNGADSDADGGGGAGGEGGVVTNGVTFHKDIEPILQDHCQTCHSKGGIAPMPLITYSDAQTFAPSIKSYTASRAMPPWGARPQASCTPRFGFKSDPSLTDAQIKLISDWVAGGSPEGDPKDAPPAKAPPDLSLKNTTQSIAPTAPYALKGQTDQFRCFVLDPKLAVDEYLTGYDILPGNKTIVHHALVFAAPAGAVTQTLDASGSYDCFGGPGFNNPKLIAAWAPGTGAVDLPANVGLPLKAGMQLVMQVHYHPHANADMSPDSTKFAMRFTPTKQDYTFDPELIGNFENPVMDGTGLLSDPDDRNGKVEFRIPANSSTHTETEQFTLPAALVTPPGGGAPITPQVLGIIAHMHLVGAAEEITIKRGTPINGDPADECLLSVPAYDFNWQRLYAYDAEIAKLPHFDANDILTVKCHYNNTMSNPNLAASLLEQGMKGTSDVVLGETTLDEMCLAAVGFIYKL